jgi:hypothetical protein
VHDNDTDLLVVGAGPFGLALAAEARRQKPERRGDGTREREQRDEPLASFARWSVRNVLNWSLVYQVVLNASQAVGPDT